MSSNGGGTSLDFSWVEVLWGPGLTGCLTGLILADGYEMVTADRGGGRWAVTGSTPLTVVPMVLSMVSGPWW